MAKYSTTIDYNITTKLDASGITQLQQKLIAIESEFNKLGAKQLVEPSQVTAAVQNLQKVRVALNSAFDFNTGMLNTKHFFESLKDQGTNLTKVTNSFAQMGATGQKAITTMVSSIGRLDTQLKTMSTTTNKIFTTLGNTVRWGLIASAFQTMMNSAHEAVQYMKDLDKSLTDIQMVGHSSAEEMRQLALEANEAAKALGSTTTAYTDATKIFVQQGLSTDDAQQFAEMSLKLSNVAGESAEDAAEQITALKNGFQMAGDSVESSLDKIVKTSHITASSVEELATAATRVAATANTLGVSDEQLYSQLSTIIQVTREAPEIVGNSLKTIYARLADLKLGETLEDGMQLGSFSKTLQKIGVDVLDSSGQLREMGIILEDLMTKWQELDRAQKQGAAIALAGKFQYNRLMTLMENAEAYKDTLNSLQNDSDVDGLLNAKQADVYMESLEGKANKLKATFEGMMSALFNQRDFSIFLDGMTKILETFNEFIKVVGGGIPVITLLGSTLTKVFSAQIAQGIGNMLTNNLQQQIRQANAEVQAAQLKILQTDIKAKNGANIDPRNQQLIDYAQKGASMQSNMSEQQIQSYNEQLTAMEQHIQNVITAEDQFEKKLQATNEIALIAKENIQGFGEVTKITGEDFTLTAEQCNKLTQYIQKISPALQETSTIYSSFIDTLDRSGATAAQEAGLFSKLDAQIAHLGETGVITSIEANELRDNLIGMQAAIANNETDKFNTDLAEVKQRMQPIIELTAKLGIGFFESEEAFRQSSLALEQYGIAADNAATGGQKLLEQVEKQVNIQSIVNAISALGQLAFAFQSIQHLGSIWSDEDISLGEKLLQTFMNLGIVIPTLISVFKSLRDIKLGEATASLLVISSETADAAAATLDKQAKDKLALSEKKLAEAIKQRIIAQQAGTTGNMEAAAAASAAATALNKEAKEAKEDAAALFLQSKAAKESAGSVTKLGKVLGAIASPAGILAGITIAVAGGFALWADQQAKAKEELQKYNEQVKEEAESAREILKNLDSTKKGFDELYASYKRGEANSSELSSAAESLNNVLDDQELKVYAAAEAWDLYNARVQKLSETAEDEARQKLSLEIASGNNEAIENYKRHTISTSDSNNLDEDGFGTSVSWEGRKATTSVSYDGGGYTTDREYISNIDSLNKALDSLDIDNLLFDGNNILIEAGTSYEETTRELENLKNYILENYESFNAVEKANANAMLNSIDEVNQSMLEAQQAAAALAESDAQRDFEKPVDSSKGETNEFLYKEDETIEEYKNRLKETEEFQAKQKELGKDAAEAYLEAYVTKMAEFDPNLLIEQAIEPAQEKLKENLKTLLEDEDFKLKDSEGNEYTDENADAFVENWINSIKDTLDQDSILEFTAMVEEGASFQELVEFVEGVQSGENNKLAFEPTLTNTVDFDQEELTQLLNDADMSENAFNRMASDMYNDDNGYFQKRAKELKKSIEEVDDSTEEGKVALKEYTEELNHLDEQAQDTAAMNIRMNKGLSDLIDSWEDLSAVLQDDATKGTAEYYEALSELDEIMSDVLNIDVGVLSNDFYEDADALAAMEAAANGDANAVDRLREIASHDIIMHLDIDSDMLQDDQTVEGLRNELDALRQSLQESIDAAPLELKSDVNTDDFTAKLNEMLSSSQITAEQASNILSSMGMEGEIHYKEGTVKSPIIEYNTSGNISDLMNPGEESSASGKSTSVYVESHVVGYTEAKGQIPYFEGVHYTGPGITEVSPSNSGGGTRRSSGGSGGKGGGSKGSSEKKYEPKKKDPIEEEIDRYERVDTWLQKIEKDYDKINAEQDRLAGWDKADNMTKQIELLEDQLVLQKEKLKIQKQEAAELKNELASQYGATFDPTDGLLTNYAAIHRKLEAEVNNLINQYNAATTEAEQDRLEKLIDNAQDKLDKFKDKYKRYDDLVSGDIKDTEKAIEDLKDSIEDLRIEAMKTQIEAVDNLKDLQEKLIDFNAVFSGLSKDDPLRDMMTSAEKLAKYFDDGTSSAKDFYDELIKRTKDLMNKDGVTGPMKKWYQEQIKQMEAAKKAMGSDSMEAYGTGYLDMEMLNLQMILEQIREFETTGKSSIFGENSNDLYEVAKDVFDSAADMIMDFEDAIEDLKDAILDAIDDIGDKMDERRKQYELITEELEHQREIAELLRGDRNYEEINQLLQAQQKNYESSISSMKDQLDLLKDLQKGLKEGSEEWKAVQDMIVDTQKDLNDLVEDSLKNLQEMYENTVSSIGDKWIEDTLGTDLDWMQEQWELINRNADYYLDDVNAAYNIQKLQGKYQDLLDNAGNLHTQQLITQQMAEQLGYLREKEKISEYDVRYAEMQIELLQKRIALEEAQRNKSQLKLRRDSQGNYNYVYTADTEATKQAQEDLLDAQNNAYNLSKEQMRKTQEDSLSALQDARKTIDDIWTDANLTLDEKKKRTQTVIDSLKEYLDGTSEQLSTSQKNIINDFIGMVELMTDENAARLEDVYNEIIDGNNDAFDQIDTRWSDSITDWLQNMDDFKDRTDQMFDDLIDNAIDYQDQVDQVADLVEQNFNRVTDAVERARQATDDLSASNAAFMEQLKNDAGTIKEYESVMQGYADKIRDAENAMRAYQDQVNDLQSNLVAKERENATLASQVQDLESKVKYYENGGTAGGGGSGSGDKIKGYDIGTLSEGIAGNIWTFGSWGNDPQRLNLMKQKFGDKGQAVHDAVQKLFNGQPAYGYNYNPTKWSTEGYSYYNKFSPQNFDTGGYTGDWSNNSGKIAVLHSKELVLNAADTENILSAVKMIREITQSMKLGALDISNTMANIPTSLDNMGGTIDQTVTIQASFPNASSVTDIQEALLGLAEQSLQYANRYR